MGGAILPVFAGDHLAVLVEEGERRAIGQVDIEFDELPGSAELFVQ